MKWCRAFALSIVFFLAPAAAHARTEIGIGYVDEIEGESSIIGVLAWLTDERHPWEFGLGHIAEREGDDLPDGSRFDTPAATFVSASKRYTFGSGWFVSAGVALVDVDNDVLSGHGQFLTAGGYSAEHWSVSLRHLSNADTGGRNRGETFLLFSYAF